MTDRETEAVRILGSLRSAGGKGVVRIEDRLNCSIADVWSALTEPVRRALWMGDVEGDIRPGQEFRQRVYASGWEGTVSVIVFEPPSRLRLTQTADEARVPVIDVETTLVADGDETLLVLEARGMPLELLFAYGAGWQIHVEDLAEYLGGRERRDADDARWSRLETVYREMAIDASENDDDGQSWSRLRADRGRVGFVDT